MTTGNDHKLQQEKYWVDIRKKIVRVEVAWVLEQVGQEVVEFPPMEIFAGEQRVLAEVSQQGWPSTRAQSYSVWMWQAETGLDDRVHRQP